jgi:hypothetical protein
MNAQSASPAGFLDFLAHRWYENQHSLQFPSCAAPILQFPAQRCSLSAGIVASMILLAVGSLILSVSGLNMVQSTTFSSVPRLNILGILGFA